MSLAPPPPSSPPPPSPVAVENRPEWVKQILKNKKRTDTNVEQKYGLNKFYMKNNIIIFIYLFTYVRIFRDSCLFWLLNTKSFRYVLKTVYDSIQGCVVKIYPLT